jgi:hypothetical protein
MKHLFAGLCCLSLFFSAPAQNYVGVRAGKIFSPSGLTASSVNAAGTLRSQGVVTPGNSYLLEMQSIFYLRANYYFIVEGGIGILNNSFTANGREFKPRANQFTGRLMLGKSFIKNLLLFHAGGEINYNPGDKGFSSYRLQTGTAEGLLPGLVGGLQLSYGGLQVVGRYHYGLRDVKHEYKKESGTPDFTYTLTPASSYFSLGVGFTINNYR